MALAIGIALTITSAADAQVDYQVVTSFEALFAQGGHPYAGLIEAPDGSFYGTSSGGSLEYGTVFRIDAAGAFTTLHRFESDGSPQAGLILATDGNFYGTTSGTVYKIDATGTLTTLHKFSGTDGANLLAGLIQAKDGKFYGTTSTGGINGLGTVFAMDPDGTLTSLYSFTGGSDGGVPHGGLLEASDGNLYGTTSVGIFGPAYPGAFGTVFKIDAAGTLTTLYRFDSDGVPNASLIQGIDGRLYGTTLGFAHGPYTGVPSDTYGMIFGMDSAGAVTVLHRFKADGPDGRAPGAELLQGADGSLYGTTTLGGAFGQGTIFKLDPAGTLTTLHSFAGTDGATPEAGLIQARNGAF